MKKPIRTLIVVLTLCLAAGTAAASTEPSAPRPADQQFLASLAQAEAEPATSDAPPFLWAAQGQQCPTTWCTDAAKEACQNTPLPNCDPWCSALACDWKNCTERCICVTRGCF